MDDVKAFYRELEKVGEDVTLLLPLLWDWSAAPNLLEQKWQFLGMRTKHHMLPRYVRLLLAGWVQHVLWQRIHA